MDGWVNNRQINWWMHGWQKKRTNNKFGSYESRQVNESTKSPVHDILTFLCSPHLEVILYCTMSHRQFEMNLEEIGWSGWKPRKWRGILSGYCESVMARPRWETKPKPEVCSVTLKRTRKLSAFLPRGDSFSRHDTNVTWEKHFWVFCFFSPLLYH